MNEKKPRKSDGEAASWIVTMILLFAAWPLGLVCLFSKLGGNDFLSDLIVRVRDFFITLRDSRSAAGSTSGTAETKSHVKSSTPRVKRKRDPVNRVTKGRKTLMVFGWLLLAIGVFSLFSPTLTDTMWAALRHIATAVGGAGMLVGAGSKQKRENEYSSCIAYMGDKAYVELMPMKSALGLKHRELVRDLEDMIGRGYLGKGVYIDKGRDVLVIDSSKLPEDMQPKQDTEQDGADKTDKYDLLLMEIHRASVRIKDPLMTEKTDTIGQLTASIFAAVKEDPEKLQRISSFLSYYLPTTLKLLNTYADFEEQGFQGENMSKSKARIEDVTDTLISAYTRQLDSLFLSDSIDVESDIDVLETMMKRDGLSGGDFGAGGTAVR